MNFFYLNIDKFILYIIAIFIGATLEIQAFEEDEVFDEYEIINCLSRFSFPKTCPNHFDNSFDTANNWIEADDKETIHSFRKYLYLIPKTSEPDCSQCYDCGGLRFNLYYGFENPTSLIDPKEQLHECHRKNLLEYSKKFCKNNNNHCEELSWNGGYFRRWNHKYIHFFKHFLEYCDENNECECFWPESSPTASQINTRVYTLLKNLSNEELIDSDFSPFWTAKEIVYEYEEYKKPRVKKLKKEYYPNSHGKASSLTTYTFFYSQYHQVLLSLASHIDTNQITESGAIDRIYSILEYLRRDFSSLYNDCLNLHEHPKIYYERGMLYMHSGQFEDALTDINNFMQLAKSNHGSINLTSEMYCQEGSIYAELGLYDQAIQSLNNALKLDPNNKGIYFKRAQSYFEIGQIDKALDDFLMMDSSPSTPQRKMEPSWGIKEAILNGLSEGSKDAAVDFVPSLCSSAYGLGKSLWIFAEHPIDSTKNFIDACHEFSKISNQLLDGIQKGNLDSYPPEIKHLITDFNKMSDCEKSHQIAYIIGKYGVDIFAGGLVLKGVCTFKKLKDANHLCNLEAMTLSKANKEIILSASIKHKTERDIFFKNIKIHLDRQNKHVVGTHNFGINKSIFEHKDPELLLRKFAGKGTPLRGEIGQAGYKEVVDFKTHIGIWKSKYGHELPTTKGTIHYAKDGAHIVPAHPETQF